MNKLRSDARRHHYGPIAAGPAVPWLNPQRNSGSPTHGTVALSKRYMHTVRYRWEHTDDFSPRQLGIAVHAELVRIHPFVDGNGRTTRLLADPVFLAAQDGEDGEDGEDAELYDWRLDKRRYIDLLREYDRHRDPTELAVYIGTQALGQ